MGNVVNLENYRRIQRKHFLTRHGKKLDSFIQSFIHHNMPVDFMNVARAYQAVCINQCDLAWDYIDLRETIRESMAQAFGATLLWELSHETWFDPRFVTLEDLAERCISAYIMS